MDVVTTIGFGILFFALIMVSVALHELGHINESTPNATLVVGGDGRYYNREALQTIIKVHPAPF